MESECRQLKEISSKCKSDFKKLKVEQNSLKHKADSLLKGMMRMSKNNSEISEIEKLTKMVYEFMSVNTDLLDQIEYVKSDKRSKEKLDATCVAHAQSVRFQISTYSDSHAAEHRKSELESVISSMTEYLYAK